MFLPAPLLVSATVNLALAPLRRIRLLMSVEDALAEEGVVPCNKVSDKTEPKSDRQPSRRGFGGAVGAAKFLYQVGGIGAFYRGAALEYAGVVIKYAIQVAVIVPICRRVPLQMQRSYMLTTLMHTFILFIPIAPVQLLIDTVVVNACSDFVPREEEKKDGGTGGEAESAKAVAGDGKNFRFRFRSLWEAARAAWNTLPILPLANKLMLLDFAGRYISSLVFNKVIGFFYDKLLGDNGGLNPGNERALRIMMRVVPPIVSICYGLLTYPVVNLPFSHFVRVRLHEREAADRQKTAEEEEREHRRTSTTRLSRSMHLSAYPRPEEDADKPLVDRIVEVLCHWDVRDYLYFTYERGGLRGLYRGYSMQVATIALGVGGGAVVSEALTYVRGGVRHALRHYTASH